MTPEEFYLQHYDAADPFGSYKGRDPDGPGHLGIDINGLPEGTEIPSWCDGVVHAIERWSSIGWCMSIAIDGGGYSLNYHMLERPPFTVGDRIAYGQTKGRLGNTGTVSTDPHDHEGFSYTDGSIGTGAVVDPWPVINFFIETNGKGRGKDMDLKLFWRCVGNDPALGLVDGVVYLQDSPVSPVLPYGDPSTMTALTQQHKAWVEGGGSEVTRIAVKDLARLVGFYGGPNRSVGPSPQIDYAQLAKAIKDSGALDLVIAGTARPASSR